MCVSVYVPIHKSHCKNQKAYISTLPVLLHKQSQTQRILVWLCRKTAVQNRCKIQLAFNTEGAAAQHHRSVSKDGLPGARSKFARDPVFSDLAHSTLVSFA